MLSPTINIAIEPDDFLKLCKEPEKYFEIEGKELFYKILPLGGEPVDGRMGLPSIKIDDITVTFAHTNGKTTELIDCWNMMRKKINWENMIFVFRITDRIAPVSKKTMRDFSILKRKHLILNHCVSKIMYQDIDQVIIPEDAFGTDRAIENDFDLLGWLNQEEVN